MMKTSRYLGFSLIELLVVLVIISIIGIIGIPSYRGYMQRAQRTEAKDALVRLATNQERFYLQNNTYTSDVTQLGFSASAETEGGLYGLSVVANQLTFTATAAPTTSSGLIDPDCTSFTINQAGTRGASPDPAGKCW